MAAPSGPALLLTQQTAVWPGGDGAWSGEWQCHPIPQFGKPLAFWIDGGNEVQSSVFLDIDATVAALIVDPDDALYFLDGRSLNLASDAGGSILNNGLIRVCADHEPSTLMVGGDQLLVSGSGAIELTHTFNSRIIDATGRGALLNNASHIRGAGVIGDGLLRFINQGLVNADLALEPLRIHPPPSPVINAGVLQAQNGGMLLLGNGTYGNTGGLIIAHDDSHVEIDGASVIGGTLRTIDTGIIRAHVDDTQLSNLTLEGRLELGLVRLTLSGQVTNNGEIKFIPEGLLLPGEYAEVFVPPSAGDVTLAGNGVLRLVWAKVHSGSAIPPRLINLTPHTMQGEGLLGYNTLTLTNAGTIIADRDNPLVIDPPPGQESVNTGTIRAAGLGGVVMTSGVFRNNGTIEVMPGSRCYYTATAIEANVANSMLAGGIWRIIAGDGTAFILMPGPGIFFNAADVTLSGPGASFSIVDSMLVNAGRFAIHDGRNFTTQGAFFSNDGELVIGHGCKFSASGSLTLSPVAALDVELSSANLEKTSPSVACVGPATLSGTLRLAAAPDFALTPGQRLHILSASAVMGQFVSVEAPPGVQIRYEAHEVVADVIAACSGDLTGDAIVNVDDLLVVMAQWGACSGCAGDLNGDMMVDVGDLLTVINAWGECP